VDSIGNVIPKSPKEFSNMETSVLQSPAFSAFKVDAAISFIRPFNPKEAISVDGYRNSVIRYRDTTKGVAVKPAKVVTIPQVTLPEDVYQLPDDAKKVLLGVLEDQQDTLIRDLIDNGATLIEWDKVSLENCLTTLTAVRVSQRLTKEQIEAWARVALASFFAVRAGEISDNQRHDDVKRSAQLALTTNAYIASLSSLSAPVPNLSTEKATALKNALTVARVNDDISKSLFAKIDAILNPKIDNLDGL